MNSVQAPVVQPTSSQTALVTFEYVCYKYGKPGEGFLWDYQEWTGFTNRRTFTGYAGLQQGAIRIPLDPITVVAQNLASPEELEFPPGIVATFRLLKA